VHAGKGRFFHRWNIVMASALPIDGIDKSTLGRETAQIGDPALHFMRGGGEMGARMRLHDWSSTPLGPAATWPQSLKTIVRVMLDSRYAMWMLWGPDITFFCNDSYLPTLGIKRDWALGQRADKVWEEIWPDVGPRIDHVLRHGEATWDEALLLFLGRSGFSEETYHTFSYSPVYDDANRVAGMLCVVTEVTERVIGERRLRVLSELAARSGGVESVADSCRAACDVLARFPMDVPFAAFYLTEADAHAARRFALAGVPPSRSLPELLEIGDGAQPWPLGALYASENVQELVGLPRLGIDIAAGDWPDRVERALVLPLKVSAVGLCGFLIAGCSPRRPFDEDYRAFLDLVASQVASAIGSAQAYEAERRRAEALAELDRAKTAFFSNVSHEFRTPLTLMQGPLEEAVNDPGVPPAIRDKLALAQRNAARLQRLVNSLLDFSRLEAGRTQANYEPTDLAVLTRDLASTFRSAMEKAGLAYAVECAPLPHTVHVDREMWEKIVLNLLSNAFKFTLSGGVTLRLSASEASALLEVRDTGVGIPASELPRLFERFHRVESTEGRTHEGSGIGLALVQELVRLHGGSIDATSTLGAGTTFRVHIPLGTAHLPQDRIRAAATPTPMAIASAFVEEALRWLPDAADSTALMRADTSAPADRRFAATFGSRIVLADDNADMRAYVRGLLAPYYLVETVSDGRQALAAARRATPDLILSDVMMPARRLRAARGRARRCRAQERAGRAAVGACRRGIAHRRPRFGCRRLRRQAILGARAARAGRRDHRASTHAAGDGSLFAAAHGAVRDAAQRSAARPLSRRCGPRDPRRQSDRARRVRRRAGPDRPRFCRCAARILAARPRRRDARDLPPHAPDRRALLRARARLAAARPRHARLPRVAGQPHPAAGRRLRRRLLFPRHFRPCARARRARIGEPAEGRVPGHARP